MYGGASYDSFDLFEVMLSNLSWAPPGTSIALLLLFIIIIIIVIYYYYNSIKNTQAIA